MTQFFADLAEQVPDWDPVGLARALGTELPNAILQCDAVGKSRRKPTPYVVPCYTNPDETALRAARIKSELRQLKTAIHRGRMARFRREVVVD